MTSRISISASLLKTAAVALALCTTACNAWLSEPNPASTELKDFFTSGTACEQAVNGCYSPLQYEYNDTYFSEWFIGDIASDDALKGGQNVSDNPDAYDIDNFKTNANNVILRDYYRAKYLGIIRCNLVLREVAAYEPDETLSESKRDRLLGEANFLRALYYFQLVRVFGGVPLIHDVIDSSERWLQPRASVSEVYESIISDLTLAEQRLWERADYPDEDLGRATRGAAIALLCKAYLYNKDYENAYLWGKRFVDEQYLTGRYSLLPDVTALFSIANENNCESVFEIQYTADPTGDYGEGFGFTRGTFSSRLLRPRMSALALRGGWGFDHPTHDLYNEFEAGDPRRESAIGVPDAESALEAEVNYLGSPYYNNKLSYTEQGTFPELAHDARGPLNYPLIRTADVLLLYAEAALESGLDPAAAKWALEEVRSRARACSADPDALPAFPAYRGYTDTPESLREAIRHERRVELAMEGHRWFDITRWGIAANLLNKNTGSYASAENEDVRAEMALFTEGKHELFPIPSEEIILNPMEQNPGY